jgi:RecA-family ATPase
VKGLIPPGDVAFIGGQSGAGKTFIAIYLAVSLASGRAFFGRRVKERVGVAILAAEGAATIKH